MSYIADDRVQHPDPPSKWHGFTIMWPYVQRIALTHANLHFRKKKY